MSNDTSLSVIQRFKNKINPGVILIFVATIAIIFANSSLREFYQSLWEIPVILQIGNFNLFSHHGHVMNLGMFINDVLMAIFFFMIGLEVKREILYGELSNVRQALLPVVAACGGMIIPTLFFFLISPDAPGSRGCAIPMATDIAFSLGVLSLLGNRVPLSIKIFLTTLAVADDIGGIIVIAIFYSGDIVFLNLIISVLIVIALLILAKHKIYNKFLYIIPGIFIWYLFLESGVHATIAGVVVAFCIPSRPKIDEQEYVDSLREKINNLKFDKRVDLTATQIHKVYKLKHETNRVVSPLQQMEYALHPIVNYIIMPLFAFANAGVVLEGIGFHSLLTPVTLGVFVGLFAGKTVGIFSFTWLFYKLGFAKKPEHLKWSYYLGVSMIGGIGFTVSLFIAGLSYTGIEGGAALLNEAKLGIVLGSLISGIVGFMFMKSVLPNTKKFR